ncbi:amidase [Alkalicoccus urumqiensis]|uniref:amidase n=1 Tax=Alkalicoccus urumqiensis TaxID=1548213 RepID=UPI00115BF7F6|nr:amidase [Alkalicoccus urumqiensis]
MYKKAGIMLMALVVLFAGTGAAGAVEEPMTHDRATWFWDTWQIHTEKEAVLDFLESRDVTKIHLQVNRDVPASSYASFIQEAGERGMDVYALDGAPEWAAPKGERHLQVMLTWLTQYQQNHEGAARFAGIHLDVEPYLYEGWRTNQAKTVLAYQQMTLAALTGAEALSLPLEMDLPFWFDEITYKNKLGRGVLAEWVISKADGVTLMSYRDSADVITELIRQELIYGEKHGTPITAGVETMASAEGAYLTFYEEGEAYMNQELEKLHGQNGSSAAFAGHAVHHVGSWRTMKP